MADAIKALRLRIAAALLQATLSVVATNAWANPAGEIVAVEGVASVQRSGGEAVVVGGATPLEAGDVLTTGPKTEALVRMADGTRLTLGPESRFALTEPSIGQDARSAMAAPPRFRLLKGTVRVRGAGASSEAAHPVAVRTPAGTVSLSAGEADVRVCDDCQAAGDPLRIAQIVRLAGDVQAVGTDGVLRHLLKGSALHGSDIVATSKGAYAVIAFLDKTRLTLEAQTRVRIAVFRYEPGAPEKGQLLLDLITGGLRELTGLIGQFDHRHVEVRTTAATVGVRGTGFDLRCLGTCAGGSPAQAADEGLAVSVWQGAIVLNPLDTSGVPCAAPFEVAAGQSARFRACDEGAQPVDAPANFTAPRPDQVDIEADPPFDGSDAREPSNTVWVRVREGQALLNTGEGAPVVVSAGETAYADESGVGRANAMVAGPAMPSLTSPEAAPGDLAAQLTQWRSAQCRP